MFLKDIVSMLQAWFKEDGASLKVDEIKDRLFNIIKKNDGDFSVAVLTKP